MTCHKQAKSYEKSGADAAVWGKIKQKNFAIIMMLINCLFVITNGYFIMYGTVAIVNLVAAFGSLIGFTAAWQMYIEGE